jgi:hypothetical protein
MITSVLSCFRRNGLPGVTFQPSRNIDIKKLFTPQHACKCLSLYIEQFFIFCGRNFRVKLIRFSYPVFKYGIKFPKWLL